MRDNEATAALTTLASDRISALRAWAAMGDPLDIGCAEQVLAARYEAVARARAALAAERAHLTGEELTCAGVCA